MKTGGRLVKHARYYWLMLAETRLTRRLFGSMARRIELAPQFVGLYQISLTIPTGITPSSSVPVVIKTGNIASPANVYIAIQ